MAGIDWSAISNQLRAGRVLRLPLALIPRHAALRVRRGAAKGMRWIAGSAAHGCWLGTYESDKQQALARFINPGMTIYDIGAQAGFYTLIFSRLVGASGRVIAFEPCPVPARDLLEHLRINDVANVRLISAAVSDRAGLASFTVDMGSMMNSLTADGSPLMVATIALDQSELPPPDLIKIDVEGAESAVLTGARQMLARHHPIIFVALHNQEQKHACDQILREIGYRIFDLAGEEIQGVPHNDEIYALAAVTGRRPAQA